MRSLILCAGKGSRFNTQNNSKPKCLIEINKKKIIDMQIFSLQKNHINDIAIVTGFKSQLLNHDLITKSYNNKDWENTNMVYSLFSASEWLNNSDCLISYGDIFYSHLTIKKLIESKEDINILYHLDFMEMWKGRYEDPYSDLESFKISKTGHLEDIGHKVSSADKIMGQFMGLIYIKKNGWDIFKNILADINIEKIDFTSVLQHLVNNKISIKCIPTNEIWGEIDTINDLKFYEKYYENRL